MAENLRAFPGYNTLLRYAPINGEGFFHPQKVEIITSEVALVLGPIS